MKQKERKKSIVMRADNKYTLEKSKTKQMPTVLKERKSNWTLALSSRAFQVRKIDRINTYLAVYGTVWRLKINSHQHDTMQKENAIREKQQKKPYTHTHNKWKKEMHTTPHTHRHRHNNDDNSNFGANNGKKHVCTFFFLHLNTRKTNSNTFQFLMAI